MSSATRLSGLALFLGGCFGGGGGVGDAPGFPDAAPPDGAGFEVPETVCVEGDRRRCACGDVQQVCRAGEWTECVRPVERCDGADRDCDGAIDEGFDGIGEPCNVGVGACYAEGVQVCAEHGQGTECSARVIRPRAETCDGVDEDCDGEVDEELAPRACHEGDKDTQRVGQCADGVASCIEGAWVCDGSVQPGEERCDGVDNDCDGAVDEGPEGGPLSERCGADGEGPCAAGRRACQGGFWGECVGAVGPSADICDGVDNDCNGAVDDGEPCGDCDDGEERPCYGGPEETLGVGVCRGGRQACADGRFGACVERQLPEPERCNGLDDDCDGVVDEAIEGVGGPCRSGAGACAAEGRVVCDAERGVLACDAAPAEAAPELCNNADDDCDGVVDEGLDLGKPCATGAGECATDGELGCGPDGEVVCRAVPREPGPELCNGLDDDCDGASDEGFDLGARCAAGEGACQREGVLRCGADGVECSVSAVPPQPEACDGADNDCDGAIDEGDPGGGQACDTGQLGVCAEGVRRCVFGDFLCERVGEPGDEICDGLDNDCDGRVDADDEGPLSRPCYDGPAGTEGRGACAGGEATCDGGRFGECAGQRLPADEVCDGADDDCDGVVDERPVDEGGVGECVCQPGEVQPCAVDRAGVGQCRAGERRCDDQGTGFGACEGAVEPDAEVCDGLDNDCDGQVDEVPGAGEPCAVGVGACARDGALRCDPEAGRLACDAVPGAPAAEVCDGVDNDCDGDVDDVPGLGEACVEGVGACARRGDRVCVDGALACSVAAGEPAAEVCDGVDDDCDGVVDEESPGVGEACSAGEGACFAEGTVVCAGAEGPRCDAVAGEPRPEKCDGIDDDCDGAVDEEASQVGEACTVGVGACQRDGAWRCARGGLSCAAEPGAPEPETCNDLDDDCDGLVDEHRPCAVYRSCRHALEDGHDVDGVYRLQPGLGAAIRDVFCDQNTDGGGWTLVGSTRGETLNDAASEWHPDLLRLDPVAPRDGVWDGLRPLNDRFDLRFACRADAGAADAPLDVDLSFYDVPWYEEITRGTDAESCFSEGDGVYDDPPPLRRDLLSGAVRPRGAPWAAGFLEGEDACADVADFAVDFDTRGVGAAPADAWGEADGVRRCGATEARDGQWFVFARERGRVAVVGAPAHVLDGLRAGGLLADALDYDAVDALVHDRYDTVLLGQGARGAAPAFLAAVEAFAAEGGHVVTEGDGAAALLPADDTLVDAPGDSPEHASLEWYDTAFGAGAPLDADVTLPPYGELRPGGDFHTFAPPFVDLAVRGTFRGDGSPLFPEGAQAAVLQGRRCDANVVLTGFDWAAPALGLLAAELVRVASAPPTSTLVDACPVALRPELALCGSSDRDVRAFGPGLRLVRTCRPGNDTQALLVTRHGLADLDPSAVRRVLDRGGSVITEYSVSDEVFAMAFLTPVAQGSRHGRCRDNPMPAVLDGAERAFWHRNAFEPTPEAHTGCGFDLSHFPGVVRLGGWTPETTQIAWRDRGPGRLWLVEADWQDTQEQMSEASIGLMRYMVTHGANGRFGRP